MSSGWVDLPVVGVPIYPTISAFPSSGNTIGQLGVAADTGTLYEWNGSEWIAIANPGAAIAIDSLTGDVTASGPGSAVATLATVNPDPGSYGSSTSIPSFTVNAKGLITAASDNVVIAPAGTLTGTTIASGVVSSSLTSVGTISSGVWNGTATGGFSFLTSGTTYTTPAGITANTLFKFTLVGGGGGGGGFAASGSSSSGGGAGGAGIVWVTGLTPSTGYTYAIGAAGSAGIATTPGDAGNGGNTTLTIGATTYTARGGAGSPGGSTNVNGGAGGTTTNFTIGITGQNGMGASNNSPTALGAGGSTGFGLGLGGAASGALSVGNVGTGFGGGGAGAHGPTTAGGAGAAGAILVEWNN